MILLCQIPLFRSRGHRGRDLPKHWGRGRPAPVYGGKVKDLYKWNTRVSFCHIFNTSMQILFTLMFFLFCH